MGMMRTILGNIWGLHVEHRKKVIWLLLVLLSISLFSSVLPNNISATPRQNNPPEAVISSPENAAVYDVGAIVNFDGSESTDPDNDALTYTWDFGDGETGTGAQTTHTYSTPWVPIITLTVSDGDLEATDRVVIIIGSGGGQNRPPTASIDEPTNFDSFTIGEIIVFDGSSSSDPEDDSLTYVWDFGDGNTSSGEVTTHAYSELNPYVVKLTVSDGIFNDSERIVIFVNNTPPTADAGEDQLAYPGKVLTFNGENSSDPDRFSSIDNYTWDMGDKTTKYGSEITHSYARYGSFTVTLTVTDNHGAMDTDELKVIITNAAPVAILRLGTPNTYANYDIEFDATDSYDPDGVIEEYSYDFGDGTETDWIYESVVYHSYSSTGEYEVTLMVRDDRSETSEPVTLNINVIEKVNKAPTVSITYPLDGDSVAETITIQGSATDPDGEVTEVEIKIDDNNWDEADIVDSDDGTVTWEYDWDTEDVSDGEHLITARAYDDEDYSEEVLIDVSVNNQPTTFIELTQELNPTKTKPREKVTVSGTVNYDTDVPVTSARIEITITETNKKWVTQTNSQGKYSYKITAPDDAGIYTIKVYVTDGTLERETTKKLTVEHEPPELEILAGDISFSDNRPTANNEVKITAKISNLGGTDASGTLTFYLDTIGPSSQIVQRDIDVSAGDITEITVSWTAVEGNHNIIIELTDVEPQELDTTNNVASKEIRVLKAPQAQDLDDTGISIIDQFGDLPPMYRYGIIGLIIIVVLIIILVVYGSISKSRKKRELEQNLRLREEGKPGMVVFKPLGNETEKTSRSKAPYLVITFAVLSIIMMAASMYLPWYQEKIDFVPEEEGDTETMLLVQYSFSSIYGRNAFLDIEETFSWDDESFDGMETTKNLYLTSQRIIIAGLAMSILLLIGAILTIVKKWKKIAVIFGILAFILCLIGPLLFMMQHPSALAEDNETDLETEEEGPEFTFFGTSERESNDDGKFVGSWGPGYGWYLSVLGSIFAFLGFILALKIPSTNVAAKRKTSEDMQFKFIDTTDEDESGFDIDRGNGQPVIFESLDDDNEISKNKQLTYDTIGIR